MTEYIILRRATDDDTDANDWTEFDGLVEASSASRALAAAKVNAGRYVAIPWSKW